MSRRRLRQSPAPRLRQRTVLIYAVAATLVTVAVGVLIFVYFNLGNSNDSLASARSTTYTSSGTGDWDDATSWEKSQPKMDDTPGDNVNVDAVNIRGYISKTGNLRLNGKTIMTIYDTLRVVGDITLSAGSELIIEENGLLIVENDYITDGSSRTTNDGTVVGVRNFRGTGNSEIQNNHLFYVYGDVSNSGGSTYNGVKDAPENSNFLTERNLMDDNTPLYEFSSGVFVMPITLAYFKANTDGNQTLLEWQTVNEENNDFFTIERSEDGKQFYVLDHVNGAGNSDVELSYEYIDPNPSEGANYYRLKQTDYNGDFEYFNIEVVYHDQLMNTTPPITVERVGPNPFQHQINVHFMVQDYIDILLKITDINGRVLDEQTYSASPGANAITYHQGSQLPSGMYLLTLSSAHHSSEPFRLVKR